MIIPTDEPMLAYLRARADAPAYWLMGILWMMLARAQDSGGRFTSTEQLMSAGPQAESNQYETQRKGFYMLEDRGRFVIDDLRFDAGPQASSLYPERRDTRSRR